MVPVAAAAAVVAAETPVLVRGMGFGCEAATRVQVSWRCQRDSLDGVVKVGHCNEYSVLILNELYEIKSELSRMI